MTTDKLPEWPGTFSPADISYDHWLMLDRDAALARMEALVEYAREVQCHSMHHAKKDRHGYDEPCPVMIRLHELLAACERRSGG